MMQKYKTFVTLVDDKSFPSLLKFYINYSIPDRMGKLLFTNFSSLLWFTTLSLLLFHSLEWCILSNCAECEPFSSVCDECNSGYLYFDYLGCRTCNPSTFPANEYNLYEEQCNNCPSGQYLKADYSCALCTTIDPNCAVCIYSGTAVCSLCSPGYYSTGASCILCRTSIANCTLCNAGPECISCDAGYGLIPQINSCVFCDSIFDPSDWEIGCNTLCLVGSFLDGSYSCVQCKTFLDGCTTCKNAAVCLECDLGFYLNTTANNYTCGTCLSVLYGCGACNSATQCVFCVSGYYMTSNADCEQCGQNIPGCMICQDSTFCLECHADYYLDAVAGTCTPCIGAVDNCVRCNHTDYCLECQLGFFLNGGGLCERCATGCNVCSADDGDYCFQCSLGYYAVSGSCSRCGANCLACLDGSACLECEGQMTLDGAGGCIDCPNDCLTCNEQLECLSCPVGFFFASGSPNYCVRCPIGCAVCDGNTTALSQGCFTCFQGYSFEMATNSCVKCDQTYPNCIKCNASACLQCHEGFFLDPSTGSPLDQCLLCSSSMFACQICQSVASCLHCAPGFALLGGMGNNSCEACPAGCLQCDHQGNCSLCSTGYFMEIIAPNTVCSLCVSPCLACLSLGNCLSCINGFFLNGGASSIGGTCESCNILDPNCLTCNYQELPTLVLLCRQCAVGFYLQADNTSCQPCTAPCVSCQMRYNNTSSLVLERCDACQIGYYLNSDQCFSCAPGCADCYDNISNCSSCFEGFYLGTSANGTFCIGCETALRGCLKCENSSQCIECQSGFYLDSATGSPTINSCLRCYQSVTKCLNCFDDGGTVKCLHCDFGYFVAPGQLACISCSSSVPSCLNCSAPNSCTRCQPGFFLPTIPSSPICSPCDMGCIHCQDAAMCLECSSGYVLSVVPDNHCELCSSYLTGCQMCNEDASECFECYMGFYLDRDTDNDGSDDYADGGGVCEICSSAIEGCSYCKEIQTLPSVVGLWCTKCLEGFYLNQTTSSTTGIMNFSECLQCSTSIPGCLFCNSFVNCTLCHDGFFLDSGGCKSCGQAIPGCFVCNDSATECLRCSSGYYLNAGICSLCHDAVEGCFICHQNQTLVAPVICQRCESGYFLKDTNTDGLHDTCLSCMIEGCQVCAEDETNHTYCITCNGQYYMSTPGTCNLCRNAMPNCANCIELSLCLLCDSGFYPNDTNCDLCSTAIQGCSICQDSDTCIECKAKYYLNSSGLCSLCSSQIDGCSICEHSSECLLCAAGFFLNQSSNFLCQACHSALEGCLFCSGQENCDLCDTQYYQNVNGLCLRCDVSMEGCFSCLDETTCTSCKGGYDMNFGECQPIDPQQTSYLTSGNLILVTYFLDNENLKHVLRTKGGISFREANIDWNVQVEIFIEVTSINEILQLAIHKVEWGKDGVSLYLFTNNPLTIEEHDMRMPFARRLQPGRQANGVLEKTLSLHSHTRFRMTERSKNQILVNYPYSGDLSLSYDLEDAQFYASYMNHHSNFLLQFVGMFFVVTVFVKYSIKALKTVPQSLNMGNIIPHILAFKVGALLLYPTYLEYVQFCMGFMYSDFPWFNESVGQYLGNPQDNSPPSFKMFYVNMNMGSMYMLALLCLLTLVGVTIIMGKRLQCKPKMHSYLRFLTSFFIFGTTFASCCSLQSAVINPVVELSINSFLHILGILIYTCIFCEVVCKVYYSPVVYFWRLRVLFKASLLSLAHFSPVYLLSIAVIIDIIMLTFEYRRSNYSQYFGGWWLFPNIAVNFALVLLVFLPVIQLSLITVSLFLLAVLICEGVMHYREIKSNQKVLKMAEEMANANFGVVMNHDDLSSFDWSENQSDVQNYNRSENIDFEEKLQKSSVKSQKYNAGHNFETKSFYSRKRSKTTMKNGEMMETQEDLNSQGNKNRKQKALAYSSQRIFLNAAIEKEEQTQTNDKNQHQTSSQNSNAIKIMPKKEEEENEEKNQAPIGLSMIKMKKKKQLFFEKQLQGYSKEQELEENLVYVFEQNELETIPDQQPSKQQKLEEYGQCKKKQKKNSKLENIHDAGEIGNMDEEEGDDFFFTFQEDTEKMSEDQADVFFYDQEEDEEDKTD